MKAQPIFYAILAMTMLNGFISPALAWVVYLAPAWLPEFLMFKEAVFYGAILIVAFSTLLISGVPAALFERFSGRSESDETSLLVWLGAAGLLTLPGLF